MEKAGPADEAGGVETGREKRNGLRMGWEENVRKVVPYTPGEQPGGGNIIKLNTNENPYPPPPGVLEAVRNLEAAQYALYPDPDAGALRQCLAEYYGLETERVFVGVGSDDVLALSFLTFFHSGRPVLFPDITYSFYDVWANLYGIPYRTVPLRADFTIDEKDYMCENGGIIFPNPNAPTGVLEPLDKIEAIVRANPNAVVIVDEAYIDFGGESALPLLDRYENLLLVRTFSKSRSLAGLRIGFALGSKKLIGYLQDVKFSFNSYTMNLPSLAAGVASIADEAYFREQLRKVEEVREWVKKELKAMGFSGTDSMSNFVFVTHPEIPAKELFLALREAGIYVRYFEKPRIDRYLRISIGTREQMHALLTFLKQYIAERK